ncbi:hypothetical protein DM01DRAFT_1386865 [Hesseltinella vesiculosa]|uniref:Uncharacterized protein n=1 Tax=Hesseltinella vesiculosa TaxID=101127 RepID=A0A1X2G479_9FUNG|nr:hypothetical protein DM01DRAFT_1386865 [Hesseltinella vesiculosa]
MKKQDSNAQLQDETPPFDVLFLVRDEYHLQELVSLICHRQAEKTIAVLATGIPIARVKKELLSFDKDCHVWEQYQHTTPKRIVYSLDSIAQSHLSWQTIANCLTQMHYFLSKFRPSVIIHSLPISDPLSKCLPSESEGTTIIRLPPRDAQHATWLMELPLHNLKQWHKFKIQLVVTTDRNAYGLTRLVRSANRAHYLGDTVSLTVLMDQTSDRVTQQFASTFAWEHGDKHVRHRIVKLNRMPVFVEAWYPQNNYDDYAILLHDDLDVSELFYVWAKQAVLRYRYGELRRSHLERSIMGISLYSPQVIDTSHTERRRLTLTPSTTHPFLMQLVTNGGMLFFPEHWREFHHYVTARYADIHKKQLQLIEIPDARSANWTNSWRRYLDELIYLRGYVFLYPNLRGGQDSFSSQYLDLHVDHVASLGDDTAHEENTNISTIKSLFQVPLIREKDMPTALLTPSVEHLSVLDMWANPSTYAQLHETALAFQSKVSACPSSDQLLYEPSDLLCPFARLVDIPAQDATADALPTRVATLFVPRPTN